MKLPQGSFYKQLFSSVRDKLVDTMPRNQGDRNISTDVAYGILHAWRDQRAGGGRINISAIARKFVVNRQTVKNIIERHQNGEEIVPKRRNRPKTATTQQQDQDIVDTSRDDPFKPATTIHNELNLTCDITTTRKRLRDAGLRSHVPAKKEDLTDAHKRRRLNWCHLHMNYNWDDVIFSDESSVSSNEHGQLWVRRPVRTRFQPEYVAHEKKSGRVSVSVWSFMVRRGLMGLVRIQGHLESRQYCRILQTNIIPYVRANPNAKYQQDLCTIHQSNFTLNFLRTNNVQIFQWEAKMAQFNPMENVWHLLKNYGPWNVRNADELWNQLTHAWTQIQARNDIIPALYQSMNNRVMDCIAVNGDNIDY